MSKAERVRAIEARVYTMVGSRYPINWEQLTEDDLYKVLDLLRDIQRRTDRNVDDAKTQMRAKARRMGIPI
jgi:hypothetical protein